MASGRCAGGAGEFMQQLWEKPAGRRVGLLLILAAV